MDSNWCFFVILTLGFCGFSSGRRKYQEGDVYITSGPNKNEGNVLIYHARQWGFICDDYWDMRDARVICRQLGFPGAVAAFSKSRYKRRKRRVIWLDNVNCNGKEEKITECGTAGWGRHNCRNSEAAGVKCLSESEVRMLSDIPGANKMKHKRLKYDVALRNGTDKDNGHIEIEIGGQIGVICGDGWTLNEARVACRQLGKAFASEAFQYDFYGGREKPMLISGINCRGDEKRLEQCEHAQVMKYINCTSPRQVAGVSCTPRLPDLVPDVRLIQQSSYLQDQQMYFLQCAMEENCVSGSAFTVAAQDPRWHRHRRRLLRFSSSIINNGTADFRPHAPKNSWRWHECHQHYHSMETFALYDILDRQGNRMAEGHKASFCLEDSSCPSGIEKRFNCENYGDQGISVGCKDSYMHDIDCQWIDVTDLHMGTYQLRVMINPYREVAELDYTNNVVVCDMYINGPSLSVWGCHLSYLPEREALDVPLNDEECFADDVNAFSTSHLNVKLNLKMETISRIYGIAPFF